MMKFYEQDKQLSLNMKKPLLHSHIFWPSIINYFIFGLSQGEKVGRTILQTPIENILGGKQAHTPFYYTKLNPHWHLPVESITLNLSQVKHWSIEGPWHVLQVESHFLQDNWD